MQPGPASEVLRVFLRLGVTSFGGPIAHLGFFRDEFVTRRRWLSDEDYAQLVALCQFLPGPASSQVGFALGLMRAGWRGAAAAFIGFTLPSALLMAGFAAGAGAVHPGALHGLMVVAVAIVAQALMGMARSLTPDAPRATIAAMSLALLALWPGAAGMGAAIAAGALAGAAGLAGTGVLPAPAPAGPGRRVAAVAALILAVLLLALPQAGLFGGVFRAGALVFGGGHVVLPLLEQATVAQGLMAPDTFLQGYGAAQAVPGPLFTFAAFLGAGIDGARGALTALVAIFLPGFLMLVAALPFWLRLRAAPRAQGAMRGAHAAVVGVLGAALWDPVMRAALHGPADLALAVAGFVALVAWRVPSWAVVAAGALAGVALA